jgi:hypothetical protein
VNKYVYRYQSALSFAALLWFSCGLMAQTSNLSISSASANPGGATALGIVLTVSGNAPAGLQWTVTYSPAQISGISITLGPAASSAAKVLYCTSGTGAVTCLLIGLNQNMIGSGVVAHVNATIAPGATTVSTIQLTNPIGTDSSGNGLSVTSGVSGTNTTAPAIALVSPSSAPAGSPSVTIAVSGTGFGSESVARWNGLSLATNYSSSTTLTVQIPAGDLIGQGTGQVSVANAAGPASNSFPFVITSPLSFQFLAVAACRVMDTRNPNGPFGGPFIAGGTSRTIPIPSSACGIPANASAYSLNLTAVPRAEELAFLSVWPTGQPQPLVSTLNSPDGSVIANAAIVPAGTAGAINAYATDDTDLIVDINGYFVPPAANTLQFYPSPPCRVLDTRNANGPFGGPSIAAGSSRSFPIPSGPCAVPVNAAAYVFNVTVVPQGALAFLTAWPTGQAQPFVSTLNSFDGAPLANAAIVPAGTAGAVSFYATNTADLVVDINGYFAPPGSGGLNFYPVTPCRLVDTRNAAGTFGGPTMVAGTTRAFPLAQGSCGLPGTPAGQAYSLNITVVPQGALGYLSIWPSGEAQPVVSTLNAANGQVVANAAIVPAGGTGAINVYVTNTTDVVIDTNGYFGP